MSKAGSVFSMGSGGATYEHHVHAAYLLAMLLKVEVPLIKNGTISEVAFQTTRRGFETDDLLVELELSSGEKQIQLGQIKHNIVLTEANVTFNEVINAFWKDFNNPDFDNNKDRLLLITSNITKNDKNQIGVLLDWASTHKDEDDFYDEVERIAIKKQYLSIFENVLKKANNNIPVAKNEIWRFLKCMALLVYDFTTEVSIHYNYVVNLITLTKADSCSLTGSQIWSELINLASLYNLNGGSLTFKDIQILDVYQNFSPSILKNTSDAIERLKNDGQVIIAPFENQIQNFHFDRAKMVKSLSESIDENQITIITGAAGAGKSALLKEYLENQSSDTNFFIFKAEQFNENNLSHVFSKLGITHSISDILYSIGYLQKKIIVIDAMEKLLEADAENAFQQLLTQLKNYDDVKIIFTSRAYAVSLVLQKYGIPEVKILEIEPLSNAELELALQNFPSLKPYYENKGIKEILRSPKYLQFAVKTIGVKGLNIENLSLIDFKLKLWNHIIEKTTETTNGMPRKRGKAFSDIAIKRAKSMRLFVEPSDQIAEEAVEALLKDNILFKNEFEYEFAPSHDILEDWALVRHISKIKANASSVEEFFVQIGNQPALRRAFRLWVEDYLIEDSNAIVDLVRSTKENINIEKYWVDELLISVFRSKNASSFFENFEEDLLENEGAFLKRSIVLAQTACKEYSYNSDEYKSILFPVGSVWEELLALISKKIAILSKHRDSIYGLLMDWEFRYIFDEKSLSQSQIKNCKEIVLHYIKEIENEEYYWSIKLSREKHTIENLLFLLFGLAPFAKQELQTFLKQITNKQDVPWRVQSFYELFTKLALGGIRNQNLVKEFPISLVELAGNYWKVKPKEESKTLTTKVGRRLSSFLPPSRPDKDDSWGIESSRFDYFPPSIYKTFVHTLFLINPVEAISFVTDFVNYSIDFYINSEYGKEHPLEKVILISKDGTENMQYGDASIWAIYRGHMTTHHLLECLLMSLENYLLKLAQIDDKTANKLLEEHCKYILQFSNNVALTSVITSVFMSNPKVFTEASAPIFSTRRFYEWDLNRSISEHTSMAPQDRENSNVQKERMASNALEHRRKYYQGLRAFLLPYQINYGKFNESLFQIFDRFYEKYSEDHIWIKTVSEMDVRNLKPGKIDYDAGTIELETSYPENISETLELIAEDFQDHHLDARYSNILLGAIQKKNEIAFEEWQEIYNYYSNSEYQRVMFDMPVSLASLGLNIFIEKLAEAEKQWALNTLLESLKAFLKEKYSRSYGVGIDYNIMEKSTILHSAHLLFQNALDTESIQTYKYWISKLVLCPLDDLDLREFVIYFRAC